MQWTIEQILKATGGQLRYGLAAAGFDGVTIDSRSAHAGQFFVAIRGERHDGHTFIDQVIDKGVRGVVVQAGTSVALAHDRWQTQGVTCIEVPDTIGALGALAAFQRGRSSVPVVAITGSNGKTSTRQMTALVVGQRYRTLTTQGNFNNEIGLPLTLFQLSPDHQAAVLELGMNHAGEMSRLGAICRPTIAVITNVGPAHLEFLGSLEGVARAKGELLAHVDVQGTVILNRDDAHVTALAAGANRKVVFFGIGPEAQVRARGIRPAGRGITFELVLPDETIMIHLGTPGRFMVANALAAAAVGHVLELTAAEIKNGLEAFIPTRGRLQVLETARGIHVIDDTYNANPESMAAAFDTLRSLRQGAAGIIVVGDMLELGEHAERLHREMGARAARSGAARLYVCGHFAEAVGQGAQSEGMAPDVVFIGEKSAIVADLRDRLTAGDWVLVKGSRGMAMESVVEALRSWGDDPKPV